MYIDIIKLVFHPFKILIINNVNIENKAIENYISNVNKSILVYFLA